MENNIILSICISAYNRRDLCCENVKKILLYKGDDIEVIVSDNASEDGTFEALRQIEDKRLRIYRNDINVGLNGNTIRMLTYATGKYVMTINERDWVDYRVMQAFIRTFRNQECDFILGIGWKELFEKHAGQIDGRMFLLRRFGHPGYFIVRRSIYDRLVARAKAMEVDAYTEEWMADMGRLNLASYLYAERWEHFGMLLRQTRPDKLAKLVQLRDSVNSPSIFFTPEARMANFSLLLDNRYINDADMEMYISGNYRIQVYCSLSDFYEYRKNPCLMARYHYKPDKLVCWVKIAINFYREALSVLKKKDLFTYPLALKLGVITIQEYAQLCKLRMKSWSKSMGISV